MAGGDTSTAIRLGVSMTLIQFAIGALNDLVDAPVDRIGKPGKPIPAGLVAPVVARATVVVAAAGGLFLALLGGPGLLLIGVLALAIGVWYDLRAKGTTLSWLPFALGIPLLPVFGWYGAVGSLPAVFFVLIPAAANAGTSLAIANAIVDMERDDAAGIESIALALGARRASWLVVGLQGVVTFLAIGTAAVVGAPTGWALAVLFTACVPLAGAILGPGDRLPRGRPRLARGRMGDPGGRVGPVGGRLARRVERLGGVGSTLTPRGGAPVRRRRSGGRQDRCTPNDIRATAVPLHTATPSQRGPAR